MKKAVCIGINYYNTPNVLLKGCIDDCINMKNVLIDAYGYTNDNIICLRDDIQNNSNLLPTRNNIINNLKNMILNSNNYDEICFFYSGHGSQINKNTPTEIQTIIPSDYNISGMINSDELFSIIINSKCKFLLFFDSCHSGTVCDLPFTFEYKNSNCFLKNQVSNISINNQNIFMISGCKDAQTSADTYDNDLKEYVGAFTDALLHSLRKNNHNADIFQVYKDTCIFLQQNGFSQIPILSSSSSNPIYTFNRYIPTQNNVQLKKIITVNSDIIKKNMKNIIYTI